MAMTPRQLEVLDFIVEFIREHRYAPTLKEMAETFDLSRVTVLQHVRALEEKGYLEREPNRARGMKLTDKVDASGLPGTQDAERVNERNEADVYNPNHTDQADTGAEGGYVFTLRMEGVLASDLSVRMTERTEHIPEDELFFMEENCFAIEVRTDRLQEECIVEGDLLVLNETRKPAENDLILVELENDDRSLFRVTEDGREAVSLPERLDEHLSLQASNVRVTGTVTGVIRNF